MKQKLTITIDAGLLELLRQIAEKKSRSLSSLVNHVLKTQLKEYMENENN